MQKQLKTVLSFTLYALYNTQPNATYPSHSWLPSECPNKLITRNNATTHKDTVSLYIAIANSFLMY